MPRPASLSRLATLWRSYQAINGDGIGDLPGLISRLDYLHDLGVRGLWLMLNRGTNGFRFDAAATSWRRAPPAGPPARAASRTSRWPRARCGSSR